MGTAFLIVLCCCILTVTPFTEDQLFRATNYIHKTITRGINVQYSYVAVFTADQCINLNIEDLMNALREENASVLVKMVKSKKIYEGPRMVAASYLRLDNGSAVHAEARLLNGKGGAPSPVQNLLNINQDKGCVLFYTLNSPCTRYCAKVGGRYNILSRLDIFNGIQNRALVYNEVYHDEFDKNETDVWAAWAAINRRIDFYRCTNNQCYRCFEYNTGSRNTDCY
ncbi:uncharacterized protein cbm20.L [Xenopus laevis]|uniref:Uncharacterized protein cbm20.L n=2 Tax=Xenopus laevis TaxID=8355 RepID=A0A1L8HVL8_XENLA|nr:uncharacterized protein cbm20.L [Xenopus laevis]OCU00069.1 hypothetical protein XELAEV_18005852mg [Xenopus laevis]